MYRKVLLAGLTTAAVVGGGSAALAATGSDVTSGTPTPSGTPSSSSSSNAHRSHQAKGDKHNKRGKKGMRGNLAHAQFVTKDKDGKFVTHNVIRGTVTAVSASSISVQAADKKTMTFTVGKTTKVVSRPTPQQSSGSTQQQQQKVKPTKITISKVAKGDQALVAGTGTSSLSALHVVDLGKS